MRIIAQKTDFYLNEEFFHEQILNDYVDGVAFNVVFNKEKKLFIYDYTMSGFFGIQKIQDATIENLKGSKLMPLESALESVQKNRKDLPIYLNIIPVTTDVFDEASLKQLNSINHEYIEELKNMKQKYPNLSISMHSISRNLAYLLYQVFPKENVGFVVYTGDLTPLDVDYYIFPTFMIDNTIFEELIEQEKELYIYVGQSGDISVIIDKYNSEKSTALSQKVLPHLNFIVNQPNILAQIFPKEAK